MHFRIYIVKTMDGKNNLNGVDTQITHTNIRTSSIANGTNDREAYPKHWYVAQVQMKCERKVALKIGLLGLETFIPIQTEIHQWSDRKKLIEVILIPTMVFFYGDENSAREVEKCSFVYSLLKAPGCKYAAKIPDEQIDRFKFMIGNCESKVTMENQAIRKGDKVRVIRGSLLGLEGFATKDENGKIKLSITIDYLGCASVEIPVSNLQII